MDHQSWRSKKILDLLGSRLRFSRVCIVNRCSSSDPGSNPGGRKLWAPTVLKLLYQSWPKVLQLKIQLIFIRSQKLKGVAWILGQFFLGQSTMISYHKMTIVREWVRRTVGIMNRHNFVIDLFDIGIRKNSLFLCMNCPPVVALHFVYFSNPTDA